MAENWKNRKDTLAFLLFLVYSSQNRFLLTNILLPNILLVDGQTESSVSMSLQLCGHDISILRLTSNYGNYILGNKSLQARIYMYF